MKLTPNIKMIGKVTDQAKEKALKAFNNVFENPWEVPNREKIDHTKTADQLSILKFINEETNALMSELGVEPFDLPADRYFIMDKDNFNKQFETENAAGVTSDLSPRVGILYEDTISNVDFSMIAFHETLHVKAMHVWELREEDGKIATKCVRHGITVSSSHENDLKNNKYQYFGCLHEATVEWVCERVFSKILDLPELSKEKECVHSEAFTIARRELAKKLNTKEERIRWIRHDNTPSTFVYTYPKVLLKYICEKISIKFNDKYPKEEDVFREFIRVHFTSDLVPVIRLVDAVFGEKSFLLFEKLDLENQRVSAAHVLIEFEKKRQ